MSPNAAAGEFIEAVVDNDHLYGLLGCRVISKAMLTSNLVLEFINYSADDIVSSWKLEVTKGISLKVEERSDLNCLSRELFITMRLPAITLNRSDVREVGPYESVF